MPKSYIMWVLQYFQIRISDFLRQKSMGTVTVFQFLIFQDFILKQMTIINDDSTQKLKTTTCNWSEVHVNSRSMVKFKLRHIDYSNVRLIIITVKETAQDIVIFWILTRRRTWFWTWWTCAWGIVYNFDVPMYHHC